MASPLADLDELVLKCRDEKSKSYIKEAVGCYRAGSFRAAVVSTWGAVAFDLIDKIRELSLTGDAEASRQMGLFEEARRLGDISSSLRFERDLLSVARDNLEFISHVEFLDLSRLQEDRNRCAHPSMISEEEIFSPSAELARLHITSAVEYLLQYPPSQGKRALERLTNEVNSDYFPTNIDQALINFNKSPLHRARGSLVRNFIIVLIKKFLDAQTAAKERNKITTALKAIEEMHLERYSSTLDEKLSNIIREREDKAIPAATLLVNLMGSVWLHLDDDIRHKINSYVANIPSSEISSLEFLNEHDFLKESVRKRSEKITLDEMNDVLFMEPPKPILDRIITVYGNSASFDEANRIAKMMRIYISDMNKLQINKLISRCGENDQILGSFDFDIIVSAIKQRKGSEIESQDELREWFENAGILEHYES
ncbi:hypothetical protein [Kushneria sp. EE4]